MSAENKFSGIDPKEDHHQNFAEHFMKYNDLPHSRFVKSFMHPTEKDIVITFNKVVFPVVEPNKLSAYLGGPQAERMDNFENQIKYDCLPYAENLEMMKEQGIEGTGNQQKSSDDDDLDEPDDISDFSDYEGGIEDSKRTSQKGTESQKRNEGGLVKEENKDEEAEDDNIINFQALGYKPKNIISVMNPPKTVGQFPKIRNRKYNKYLKKKLAKNQNLFNIAVDHFLDKNKMSIPEGHINDIKREFESIMEHDEDSDSQNDSEGLSNYSFESLEEAQDSSDLSYLIRNNEFKYNKIPEMDQCSFVPSPFRHMFEICYWKLNVHNVIKMKSYYFTPSSKKVTQYTAHLSLDKKALVVVTKEERRSTQAHVCLFPLKVPGDEGNLVFEDSEDEENSENKVYPIELDVDIVDTKVEKPFVGTLETKLHEGHERGFDFINKNLKGRNEMGGINVTCWNN